MNAVDAKELLSQMKFLSEKVKNGTLHQVPDEVIHNEFKEVFHKALSEVEQLQNESNDLAVRFERGDKDVNLNQVMISMQKATLSFETAVQIRNHLIKAYQEMMNIQF